MRSNRPDWLDDELFPFVSRYLTIDGHRVHYVDEGSGPVLLLLHGNPTWSFLYRHLIANLRHQFRCIAVDYPGFGLSEAATGYGFLPADHAAVISEFVDALDLTEIWLMVQDWGGPIGLHMAARRSDRFERLVIGNTWAWPVSDDPHFLRFSNLFGGRAGSALIRRFNLFVNLLVPLTHRQKRLTRAEMEHYRKPFPTPDSRLPTAIFPRQIAHGSSFLAEVEAGLHSLAHLPTLLVWGAKDVAFRAEERRRFEAMFPHHVTTVLADAGHYIQDDAPDEVTAAIRAFAAKGD